MHYQVVAVTEGDKDALARLRISAMQESLEAVGRFDPVRARARFVDGFDREATRKILIAGQLAGFYVVKENIDHLYLDHFYIAPAYQGKGIGASVLTSLVLSARERMLPLRLGALRGSRSNHFYQSHGFVPTHEDEWDIYYELTHS